MISSNLGWWSDYGKAFVMRQCALLLKIISNEWKLTIAHALEFVGLGGIIESIGMQFEAAVVREAKEDLYITSHSVFVIVTAGLELMSVDSRPCPAEVLLRVRLEFAAASDGHWLVNELLVAGTGAFLKPKVAVFNASTSLAFQAPLAFVPFLLPAVSFFPVQLQSKGSEGLKLTMLVGVRPAKVFGGKRCHR